MKNKVIGAVSLGLASFLIPLAVSASTISFSAVSPSTTVLPGNEVYFTINTDPSNPPVSYQISDSLSNSTVSSSDINNGGVFTWIPQASDSGVHYITITSTNQDNTTSSATQTITVQGPPVLSIQSLSPGTSVNLGQTVTFRAGASSSLSLTYGASDDASNSSVTSSNVNGNGYFSWTPIAQDVGNHNITITVTDSLGNVATISQAVTVNAAQSISFQSVYPGTTIAPGQTLTLTATPTGLTNPTYTFTNAFGIYSSNSNGSINPAGVFTWTPGTSDIGSHVITVYGTDSVNNLFANASLSVTVESSSTPVTTSTVVPTVTQTTVPGASAGYTFTQYLAVGMTSSEVTALQNTLKAQGYFSGSVTGYFGTITEASVKAFQAAHGIDQLGYVGPATRAALNGSASTSAGSSTSSTASSGSVSDGYKFYSYLTIGSSGTDVTELQTRLTAEGVYSGPITGYYGSMTEAGVEAYQAKYGIQQLGVVGPATRAQLNK